jgi:hypothetical protein
MVYLYGGGWAAVPTVFAWALVGKIASRAAFAEFAASIAVLPLPAALVRRPTAVAVVTVEAVTCLLMCIPATARIGLVAAAVTLAVMTAVLARSVRQGVRVTCRCFGARGAEVTTGHLVRNITIITVALLALAVGAFTGRAGIGGIAVAVATGAIGGVLLVRWDDLAVLVSGS